MPLTELTRLREWLSRDRRRSGRTTSRNCLSERSRTDACQSAGRASAVCKGLPGLFHGPVIGSGNPFHGSELNGRSGSSRTVTGEPALGPAMAGIISKVCVPVDGWSHCGQFPVRAMGHIDESLPKACLVVGRHQFFRVPLLPEQNSVGAFFRGRCGVPLVKPGAVFIESGICLGFAGTARFTASTTIIDHLFGGVVARGRQAEERALRVTDTAAARCYTAAGQDGDRRNQDREEPDGASVRKPREAGLRAPFSAGIVQSFPSLAAHRSRRSSLNVSRNPHPLRISHRGPRAVRATVRGVIGRAFNASRGFSNHTGYDT